MVSDLKGFVDNLMKKVALGVVANLARAPSDGGTPVDTGWARSNWVPQIGSPKKDPSGTYDQAKAGILPGDQQVGLAAIAVGYKVSRGPIYITNNVPYITKLDMGSSTQAPRGFIRRAIKKAVTVDLLTLSSRG